MHVSASDGMLSKIDEYSLVMWVHCWTATDACKY